MLFLKFRIGNGRYALDTTEIIEVLPLIRITPVPQAPAGVAGLIVYRGKFVPVIDLSELALGEAAPSHISTRLILVRYGEQPLGLIAERSTDVMRCDPGSFSDTGVSSGSTPYLGRATQHEGELVRLIEVRNLLASSISGVLFSQAGEGAWSTPESPRY
jgi:chemotaxis-related protein WspB